MENFQEKLHEKDKLFVTFFLAANESTVSYIYLWVEENIDGIEKCCIWYQRDRQKEIIYIGGLGKEFKWFYFK